MTLILGKTIPDRASPQASGPKTHFNRAPQSFAGARAMPLWPRSPPPPTAHVRRSSLSALQQPSTKRRSFFPLRVPHRSLCSAVKLPHPPALLRAYPHHCSASSCRRRQAPPRVARGHGCTPPLLFPIGASSSCAARASPLSAASGPSLVLPLRPRAPP
jgi:hypothetical protein